MHQYGVRDVEKLLRLSRGTIRGLIAAGFVSPGRGPRRSWRFSFQDLILLRTARALAAARVPRRRIIRSLRGLRRHLPEAMPLPGLSIATVGDRVVVREGGSLWQPDSGQYLLAFEGNPESGALSVIERVAAPQPRSVDEWFEQAAALEDARDREGALQAYAHAIAAAPGHLDAHINLGRLLHEAGRLPDAERAYREAIANCGEDALLLYNFGVLLDDMGRAPEATKAYEAALRANPALADCHYNLGLLYEKAGRRRDAIRHLSQYRRLTGGGRP